jgi:predicted nucleic acid-binding protein
MRFLIDATVLVEAARASPEPRVTTWLRRQSPLDLAISVLTIGQIRSGLERMAPGRRRTALETWLARDLSRQFQGRVLAVDDAVALEWGRLSGRSRESERPVPVVDGLLLATASVHGLTLVTRNEADCAARGVPVINPWFEQAESG